MLLNVALQFSGLLLFLVTSATAFLFVARKFSAWYYIRDWDTNNLSKESSLV